MTVTIIADRELWDRAVDESPYGLIYHKWDFLKIAEKYTGWKLLPYAVYNKTELLSLFPVFYRKEALLRSVFSPPPRSCIPYLGPTMGALADLVKGNTREKYLQTVVDEMSAEISKLAPNFVYVQMPPGFRDIRPFKWNDYVEATNFTYFIDLGRPLEQILAGFDQTLRKTVKRAEGLQLDLRQVSDAGTLYDLLAKRYAEQGLNVPIPGPGYLKELTEAFPGLIRMYSLYHGDQIISANIVSLYKHRLTGWMGNVRLGGEVAGNDIMLWTLIRKAKEEGCTEFEIQGAGEKRLWQYKSKYNPRLEVSYALTRKDRLGQAAEWAYVNVRKRRWLASAGGE